MDFLLPKKLLILIFSLSFIGSSLFFAKSAYAAVGEPISCGARAELLRASFTNYTIYPAALDGFTFDGPQGGFDNFTKSLPGWPVGSWGPACFSVPCSLGGPATITWRFRFLADNTTRYFSTTIALGDPSEVPVECQWNGSGSLTTAVAVPDLCSNGGQSYGNCQPRSLSVGSQSCTFGGGTPQSRQVDVPVSWAAPANPADESHSSYEVYIKRRSSSTYTRYTTTASTSLTFDDRNQATDFDWFVRVSFGSRSYDTYSSFTTADCRPPNAFTPNFSYACPSSGSNAIAQLNFSTNANGYRVYRSGALNGSYAQQIDTSGTSYNDSVVNSGSGSPFNYFWRVFAYKNPRYDDDGTWGNGNVGISVPTNPPGAGYDLAPTCGANYGFSPSVNSVNIHQTYANDDKQLVVTVGGAPARYQGVVRIYVGGNDGNFIGNETVCQNNFNNIQSLPGSISIKCDAGASTPTLSPVGNNKAVTLTVRTSNAPVGVYTLAVFACDNVEFPRADNPTHYRLKFNNNADSTITGTRDTSNPGRADQNNCHYSDTLRIQVLTTPWIKISGGDVGAKTGPIDLAPAPSGNYNIVQNRYGKMALISGLGIYPNPLTADHSDGYWKLSSYAPPSFTRLQVGDSSANFYSALKGATIASKVPCDSCQNSNRLPVPGEDTVYQTNGFQLNTVSGAPSHKIVIFVNGSLTINTNIPSPSGNDNGVIFIVNGDVTINNDVTTLYAAIVADGKIDINGATATTQTLNFFGSLAGSDGVNFNRDLPSDQDATNPALDLVYDSRYVQNFQNLLGTTSATNWQEVAP